MNWTSEMPLIHAFWGALWDFSIGIFSHDEL